MHTNCFALVIKLLAFSVLQFIITEVFNLRKIICNFMPGRFITCKDMAFQNIPDFRIGIQRVPSANPYTSGNRENFVIMLEPQMLQNERHSPIDDS